MKMTPIGSNKNELSLNNGIKILYSYRTPVAAFIPGDGYWKTSTGYSATTTKHINSWIPENTVAKIVDQEQINTLIGGI
jgi:hypothetical protein